MSKSINNIDEEAMAVMKSYPWPGNIRELANVLERAVVLSEGNTLSVNDLPENLIPSWNAPASESKGAFFQQMDEVEKQLLKEALERAKGNKSEAARVLGLNRSTLNSKLRKFDIL